MSSPSAFEPGVVGLLRPVLLFPEGLVDRLTDAIWARGARSAVDAGLTIFTALQEQLGLRLEPTNETIPVLVIDSVKKPSPN